MMVRLMPRLWLICVMMLFSCFLIMVYMDMMVPGKIFNRMKLLETNRGPHVRGMRELFAIKYATFNKELLPGLNLQNFT